MHELKQVRHPGYLKVPINPPIQMVAVMLLKAVYQLRLKQNRRTRKHNLSCNEKIEVSWCCVGLYDGSNNNSAPTDFLVYFLFTD